MAGGLAAVILVGGGGFLLGRGTTERAPLEIPAPAVVPVSEPAPDPGPARGVLGRTDLVALASLAADAAAARRNPGAEIADADGRRFELRLPFGCDGPASEESSAAMRWRYDEEENVLRIHVAPLVWAAEDWWADGAPTGIDRIEGFWIMRPWTSSEDCPVGDDQPPATGADAVTLPGQTLALGQIFFSEDARDATNTSRPYQAVVRVPAGELDTSEGFRLRISGRIVDLSRSGAVRCRQPAGADQRPICLIVTALDEVAIENAAMSETLATWSVAQPATPDR